MGATDAGLLGATTGLSLPMFTSLSGPPARRLAGEHASLGWSDRAVHAAARAVTRERLIDRMPVWVLPTAVLAAAWAWAARGRGWGWEVVLVVAGTSLQLAALGYATRSVWPGKVKRPAKRFGDWLRRRFSRNRQVQLKFESHETGSSSFGISVTRGCYPDDGSADEQIAWLRRTLENLGKDIDALRNSSMEIAAEAKAEARARADELMQHLEGRSTLSETDAYRAGVMAALGTVLVLVGDLLG